MATPGYSGKPLVEKLGIKPGMKLLLINPPENYVTLTTPYVLRQTCKQKEIPDLVHLFVKKEKEFIKEMNRLKKLIKKNSSVIILFKSSILHLT